MEQETRINELVNALRQRGYKITPQRLAICRVLAASRTHPTAHAVFEQVRAEFPTIGLATVYNTINALLDMGELLEVGPRSWSRFETYPEPHINLICTVCGRITDLPVASLHDLDQSVRSRAGFSIKAARVDYYGVCAECQQNGKTTVRLVEQEEDEAEG